jgi:hypothetical protein
MATAAEPFRWSPKLRYRALKLAIKGSKRAQAYRGFDSLAIWSCHRWRRGQGHRFWSPFVGRKSAILPLQNAHGRFLAPGASQEHKEAGDAAILPGLRRCARHSQFFPMTGVGEWYVSNVSIIFYAPCLFLHHLHIVSLHFVAFLCDFRN